jgi:hypothetical protein
MRRALLSRPIVQVCQNRQKHESLIPQGAGGRSSFRYIKYGKSIFCNDFFHFIEKKVL